MEEPVYRMFWSVFRKLLAFALMKNIITAANNNAQKYATQVSQIRSLIYSCLES